MSRYADPHRCPDCGGAIAGEPTCPHCGLRLHGELAQRLFTTLSAADDLLVALRAAPPVAPGPAPEPAPVPEVGRTHGLSATSVPRILLGLGAACLLVAALVFLAVTWSSMGVGGRTVTLVGFTFAAGAVATWMARRGLRGAAEALAMVALGLLALDLFGAESAGWFGDVPASAFVSLLGAALAVTGTGAAVLARRTAVRALTGPELAASVGVGLVAVGTASTGLLPQAPALVLAVLAAGLATVGAVLLDLRILTLGAGLVTGLSWLGLAASGLERALLHDTLHQLWVELHAWPLMAAAALAALPAVVGVLPRGARVLAAATGYSVLTAAVFTPAVVEDPTIAALAVSLGLVLNSAWSWSGPRRWASVPAISTGLLGLWLLALIVPAATLGAGRVLRVVSTAWDGRAGDRLPAPVVELPLSPWVLPVAVVVLAFAALALAQADPMFDRVVGPVADLRVGIAVVAAAGVGALASYPVPVWTLPTMLLAVGAGFLLWWRRDQSPVPLALATTFLLAGAAAGWYDEWLTLATLAAGLTAAGAVHLRARSVDVAAAAGAAAAAGVAGVGWTAGSLMGAAPSWTALGTLVLLVACALPLHLLPASWWVCGSAVTARAGVEVGAAASAVPVALAGVLLAPPDATATWTAVYLTVTGSAVAGVALLRSDRRPLAWPGGALLAAASWVRLWDLGVREPEPYTLPAAGALTAVGLLALRRRPELGTTAALGPALAVAVVPSLLWALAGPVGLRALLVGVGALTLLLAGTALRWTAPVVYGAVSGGLLVLRLAGPYVEDAVPRWLLLGVAGALLIAVGITWEARLREARQLVGYVRALR